MSAAAGRHLRALELPVVEAARELVGCTVTHAGAGGVIVESEASHEPATACPAFCGMTPRTRPM
ncbi:MAG: DNA-3-methyladenine glycosylase, partial [Solirubrobacteraceae bacterium]